MQADTTDNKSHIILYRDDSNSVVVEFHSPKVSDDQDIDPIHLLAAAFAYLIDDESFISEVVNRATQKYENVLSKNR